MFLAGSCFELQIPEGDEMKTNVETVARGKASVHTHQIAPTQLIEAAGIRFAYRRFANRRFGVTIDIPLLFFMHFTGTVDHWDELRSRRL
jgi:hypothetical protein